MSIVNLKRLFLVAFGLFCSISLHAANLIIDAEWLENRGRIVDARSGLLPGDTLFILAGDYQNIVLKELTGSLQKPIVVLNYKGQVRFAHEHYRGAFDIKRCKFLSVIGIKQNGHFGFVVKRAGTGSAIGINDRSTDISIAGFQILHAGFAGIMIKTDPDCDSSTWRQNFLMKNIVIEDNDISGTGGEGIYAGNTASVRYVSCCGQEQIAVYPHLIQGLVVRSNRIDSTGADGLQIALAADAIVEGNHISRYGTKPFEPYQNSGIQLGGGSSGLCKNNFIESGSGNGISAIGIIGGNRIIGNVICQAGGHGIFIDDRSDFPPVSSAIFLFENQISAPKMDGIRSYAEVFLHHLKRNIICGIKEGSNEIETAVGVKIQEEE